MAQANIVARTINEAMPGDVFMITPSIMEPHDIPWNFIVIIRVEGDDAVVQRVDPGTDKTIKGFSTKKRLGLYSSNTTFIKTARNFEQRNKDFQDKYPFQPLQNTDYSDKFLFQVPFTRDQMRDYPNLLSHCANKTRLDCMYHVLAALRLRSIDQCNKDAIACNANAKSGVSYADATNYLSKITGQRVRFVGGMGILYEDIDRILNEQLRDKYGTIVAINLNSDDGRVIGHYVIAFKEGGRVYYYDPQLGYIKRYDNAVAIMLFFHEMDNVPQTMSETEADSHEIPHVGGFAKRRKTTHTRINKMRRRRFKNTRRARKKLQRK